MILASAAQCNLQQDRSHATSHALSIHCNFSYNIRVDTSLDQLLLPFTHVLQKEVHSEGFAASYTTVTKPIN